MRIEGTPNSVEMRWSVIIFLVNTVMINVIVLLVMDKIKAETYQSIALTFLIILLINNSFLLSVTIFLFKKIYARRIAEDDLKELETEESDGMRPEINHFIDIFADILDNVDFGIKIVDKDYNIKFANKTILDGFDESMEISENQTREVFDAIKNKYWLTKRIPYKDTVGNVLGCFEISLDITQLKTSEKAALEQLELQKAAIGEAEDPADLPERIPGETVEMLTDNLNLMQNELKDLENEVHEIVEAVRSGKINIKGDAGKLGGSHKNILDGINYVIETFVNILDSFYFGIIIIDKDYNIKFANTSTLEGLDPDREKIADKQCYDIFCCDRSICRFDECLKTSENQTMEEFDEINKNYLLTKIIPYKDTFGNTLGCIEISTDITQLKTLEQTAVKQLSFQKCEVLKLVDNLSSLSKGILNIEGSVAESDEDTREIARNFIVLNESLAETARFLKIIIAEVTGILSEIADKNFSVEIKRDYIGDFVKLKNSINSIIDYFNMFLGDIRVSADQVDAGANQVASSSQYLSQGAAKQAASIQEIFATVTEVEKKTKQNAIHANETRELALKVKTDAQKGNQQMIDMLFAMEQIKESSYNISKIIKVIDDIAFQTNILSLNAAVEAARAGTYGKGFAVVAEEVRNLAARSAKAAKETTDMIEHSLLRVEGGYKIANDTAEALDKIDQGVTNAVKFVGAIADASLEQAEAIAQIQSGINQISGVTQNNTATAEESASVSEQMAAQAQMLKGLIKDFRLKN